MTTFNRNSKIEYKNLTPGDLFIYRNVSETVLSVTIDDLTVTVTYMRNMRIHQLQCSLKLKFMTPEILVICEGGNIL